MYIKEDKVRMHDTDMAGIIYFAKVFRIVHDALEDLLHDEGLIYQDLFTSSDWAFVIAHAESDYIKPMRVGDKLHIHVVCEKIGTRSFTMGYKIYKDETKLMATARTVHVTIQPKEHKSVPIPDSLRASLKKYELDLQDSL